MQVRCMLLSAEPSLQPPEEKVLKEHAGAAETVRVLVALSGKSACSSSQGPGFHPHYPRAGSQLPATPS